MAFYDPENFTNASIIDYERSHRVLQPVWDWVKDGREDFLRSGLWPPVMATSYYFIHTVPFILVDLFCSDWPIFKRWKIQKNKSVTPSMVWHCAVLLFWNHLLYVAPLASVQLIWIPPTPLPPVAPTLFEFIWHQAVWFLMFDFYYWALHAAFHKSRYLYRWIHSVHHQYHSPFALMGQHLHPFELIAVGGGVTMIPWVFKTHVLTYWSWFILSSYVSIEIHTGYDFPFAAQNWPWPISALYGGAPKHDMHHMRPMSNYEPWLTYLDKLFGWDLKISEVDKMKSGIGFQNPDDEKIVQKYN